MFYEFFAKRDKPGEGDLLGSWSARRYHDSQLRILKDAGALQGVCLEIGPGDGYLARQCREAGIGYKGVERSRAIQLRLREEGFDVALAGVPPLPYGDREFDLLCAVHVIEHLPTYEQALELMAECRRVLKPGGKLALEVPDFIRGGIAFHAWDYTHSFALTPLRLEQILLDSGFEPMRTVEFTGPLTSPPLRWPVDLVGFALHSRIVYWLARSMGMQRLLFKVYKTLAPGILVVSRSTA